MEGDLVKPAMYIFVNKGLGMSTGKTAAQVGHAAVEALRLSQSNPPHLPGDKFWYDTEAVVAWNTGGHYAKYIMECRDTEHLLATERYLNDRGFKTALIIDEGHTEIDPITPTALGVEIVNKDDRHTAATFESFKLYKDARTTPGGYIISEAGPSPLYPEALSEDYRIGFNDGVSAYKQWIKKFGERRRFSFRRR
jgi:peptidyl-tRNA hydrolase